jgi:hypothetical protein
MISDRLIFIHFVTTFCLSFFHLVCCLPLSMWWPQDGRSPWHPASPSYSAFMVWCSRTTRTMHGSPRSTRGYTGRLGPREWAGSFSLASTDTLVSSSRMTPNILINWLPIPYYTPELSWTVSTILHLLISYELFRCQEKLFMHVQTVEMYAYVGEQFIAKHSIFLLNEVVCDPITTTVEHFSSE